MPEIIINLFGGTTIGVLITLILGRWTEYFLGNLNYEEPESNSETTLIYYIKNFSNYKFYTVLPFLIGSLNVWRQWSPEILSDLILVTTLFGIAQIDIKSMLIEGRIIALAALLRLIWLLYFTPHDIIFYIAGFFFGAGLLYFVGFFYQTFRNKQGLGDGDASVLGLIGMWVGWQGLGFVVLIAALSGIFWVLISYMTSKRENQSINSLLKIQIPFAPFLCFGGLIVYLLEETGFFKVISMF